MARKLSISKLIILRNLEVGRSPSYPRLAQEAIASLPFYRSWQALLKAGLVTSEREITDKGRKLLKQTEEAIAARQVQGIIDQKHETPPAIGPSVAELIEYARLLRFVWLNPSDIDANKAIRAFEAEHKDVLLTYWEKWQR